MDLIMEHHHTAAFAPGIDRIVMLLAGSENIREVTLFPMNQNAQDLMMQAPSDVNEAQLKDYIPILKKLLKKINFCFKINSNISKSTNFSS